ncbi:MAG: methylated-DNA--[protein]-cysteine S-methyltransferase [Dokdonella sp.]
MKIDQNLMPFDFVAADDVRTAIMDYDYIDTPIGPLLLAADEYGLRHIDFPGADQSERIQSHWRRDRRFLGAAIEQLDAYFAGRLHDFDVALAARGTGFRKTVWDELVRIPYGETISYGELARRIGTPAASRAVGGANGANPLPVIVPCHRVIGSSGKLTGFGGGLPIKQWLLDHERRHAPQPAFALR